jgi:hypothetical protein
MPITEARLLSEIRWKRTNRARLTSTATAPGVDRAFLTLRIGSPGLMVAPRFTGGTRALRSDRHECLAQRRMALPNFTENRLGAVGPQPHIPTTEMKAAFGSSDVRSAALEKE